MRKDAIKNRDAILAAAGRLFEAAEAPAAVSVDDIAEAAGVGKGTIFRAFGSRSGLILELFELRAEQFYESEFDVDEGASPSEQAESVLVRLIDFKTNNRVIAAAMDASDGNPYHQAAYGRWHHLLTELVTRARGAESAEFLAHALLAATRTDLLELLQSESTEEIRAGLHALVTCVLGSD